MTVEYGSFIFYHCPISGIQLKENKMSKPQLSKVHTHAHTHMHTHSLFVCVCLSLSLSLSLYIYIYIYIYISLSIYMCVCVYIYIYYVTRRVHCCWIYFYVKNVFFDVQETTPHLSYLDDYQYGLVHRPLIIHLSFVLLLNERSARRFIAHRTSVLIPTNCVCMMESYTIWTNSASDN